MRGLLVALCACNQVYSIEATKLDVDALQRGCPALGTDPRYSQYVTQAIVGDCSDYQLSPTRTRAIATCKGPDDINAFFEASGSQLEPAVGLPPGSRAEGGVGVNYIEPRLVDDQRIALAEITIVFGMGTVTRRTVIYRRGDDARWRLDEVLPFATETGRALSSFATSDDRVFLSMSPNAEEWARRGGAWTLVRTLTPADLGVPVMGGLSQSADGLRLLFFSATNIAMYTDRPNTDAAFRPASGPITGLPATPGIVMTGDCERVYFSGLQSVFYAERI